MRAIASDRTTGFAAGLLPPLVMAIVIAAALAVAAHHGVWLHNEFYRAMLPNAAAWGALWGAHDLVAAVDWAAYDGLERARFLSNLVNHLNGKLMVVLGTEAAHLNYLAAAGALVGVFGFARLRYGKETAFYACALLAASSAAFGAMTMVFHAGKPLVLMFAALCAWIAAARLQGPTGGASVWRTAGEVAAFSGCVALALVSDETGILAPAIALALTVERIRDPRWWGLVGSALATAAVTLLLLLTVVPEAIAWAGYGPWSFANGAMHASVQLNAFGLQNAVRVCIAALGSQIVPAWHVVFYHLGPGYARDVEWIGKAADFLAVSPHGVYADTVVGTLMLGIAAAFLAVRRFGSGSVWLYAPALVALGGGSLVVGATMFGGISHPFYYGSVLTLPVAILLSVAVTAARISAIAKAVLVGTVCTIAISNAAAYGTTYRNHDVGLGEPARWRAPLNLYHATAPAVAEAVRRQAAITAPGALYPGRLVRAVYDPDHLVERPVFLTISGRPVAPECVTCILVGPEGDLSVVKR